MQVESSLSVVGPRPAELSTIINVGGSPVPGPNAKQRTSCLESPIMLLTGHQSAVYTMKFNPAGTVVASGSHDREIFLWNVHGDCKNFSVLKGHKNAVLEVQWTTDGAQIISASPDKTLRAWDVETGKQIKKMMEHSSFVNSCCPARRGPPLIVSGSDDGTAKLWDMRQRGSIQNFPDKYQITAVSFSDASDKIYTGGVDNDVKVWDIRRSEVIVTSSAQEILLGVDFADLYKNSELYRRNKALIKELSVPRPNTKDLYFPSQYSQSFLTQCLACLWKQHWSYWRNTPYTAVRFVFTTFIALTFGTMFFDLGSKRDTQQDLFNAMGSMYASVIFLGFQYGSTVQPVVAIERTVFYRERAAGMYSALPYAYSQFLIEIPYVLIQSVIYCGIVYSMMSLEWTVEKFLWYVFFMFFSLLYFVLYGMMTVAVTPNHNIAAIISTFFYALWNLFSGFIVPRPSMPVWWRWYCWANPVSYSLYGFVVSQFGDVQDQLEDGRTVEQFIRSYFGYRHDFLGVVAGIILGFVVLFTFIFAYSIRAFNFQRR